MFACALVFGLCLFVSVSEQFKGLIRGVFTWYGWTAPASLRSRYEAAGSTEKNPIRQTACLRKGREGGRGRYANLVSKQFKGLIRGAFTWYGRAAPASLRSRCEAVNKGMEWASDTGVFASYLIQLSYNPNAIPLP